MKNYYEVLGIGIESDQSTIKKAYRINAVKYHPDKNHGDKYYEDKFKEINEAYNALNDPIKKAVYDIEWSKIYNVKGGDSGSSIPLPYDADHDKKGTSKFHYNPPQHFYSNEDRFIQETPQFPPIYDHWGNRFPEDIEFVALPKKIGKIISGYSDLSKSDKPNTRNKSTVNLLKGMSIGVAIGLLILLVFSIKSLIGIVFWMGTPILLMVWIMSHFNKFKHYSNFIGVNGFAEYTCEKNRDNITKSIEINFDSVTDFLSVIQINRMNYSYHSTKYGFVWMNRDKVVLEVFREHYSKENNPDKKTHPDFWLHTMVEKYWTIYLLDNMEILLTKKGYIEFPIIFTEHGKYVIKPYIQMGIGYIKFLNSKGDFKYNYDEIKRIYSKGTTLYIEHKNFQKTLFIFKSGNRDEIPLINLANRQFFHKAMQILVGYS